MQETDFCRLKAYTEEVFTESRRDEDEERQRGNNEPALVLICSVFPYLLITPSPPRSPPFPSEHLPRAPSPVEKNQILDLCECVAAESFVSL